MTMKHGPGAQNHVPSPRHTPFIDGNDILEDIHITEVEPRTNHDATNAPVGEEA